MIMVLSTRWPNPIETTVHMPGHSNLSFHLCCNLGVSNRTSRGRPRQFLAIKSSGHWTHFQPLCNMCCLNLLTSPKVLLGKNLPSGFSITSTTASATAAVKEGVDCTTFRFHAPLFNIFKTTVPWGFFGIRLGAGSTRRLGGAAGIGSGTTTKGTGGAGSGTTTKGTGGTGPGAGTRRAGSGTVPLPTRPQKFPMSTQRFQQKKSVAVKYDKVLLDVFLSSIMRHFFKRLPGLAWTPK